MGETREMINRALVHFDVSRPETVVIHKTVDIEPQLRRVADAFSWQLAYTEGLWSLIGSGVVQPLHQDLYELLDHQSWTTVVPGSGGQSSGWSFPEFKSAVPIRVRLAPSVAYEGSQALADPDLFLHELDIENLHEGVERGIRLALSCFRNELFLPAVAMLGFVSEGAWIETGLSLLDSCVDKPGMSSTTRGEKRTELQSPYTSVLAKIDVVRQLFDRQDIFGEVAKTSGIRPKDLSQVQNWSNIVRDARNDIHYGAESALPNSYEKVAALILGASQSLRVLYAIITHAKEY